jgi:hypothetical protein
MPDAPVARPSGLRGRLPVKPVGERFAIAYMADYMKTVPTPTYPIDVSGGLTEWQMLGNGPDPTLTFNEGQPVGDCAFAGHEHLKMAKAACMSQKEVFETSNDLVREYLDYDNGIDQGCNLADVLLMWYRTGRVFGFAPVNIHNVAQADSIMHTFHGLYVGVNLTDDADELFSTHQPWTVAQGQQPDPNAGHCIVKVKAQGNTGQHLDTFVTWGALQNATQQWSAACLDEAWAVITSEDEANLVNMTALHQALNALGGNQGTPPPGS